MSRFGGWAFLVLVAGCTRAPGEEAFRPLKVGEPAPKYSVRVLEGDSIRIRAGEPLTLINIWATWCIPCRKEFPDLQQLHLDYGPKGVQILAVSVDQGGDGDVRAFVSSRGITFAIGRDPDREIERVFQTVGVPETFLIGSDGTLLWRKIGALAAGATDARAEIDAALGRVVTKSQ